VINVRPGASKAVFEELLQEYISTLARAGQASRAR
jgi:hypothetical protein